MVVEKEFSHSKSAFCIHQSMEWSLARQVEKFSPGNWFVFLMVQDVLTPNIAH